MNADEPAFHPKNEVQDRDVAKPDNKLWVCTRCGKVESIGYAIGTLSAACRKECADMWVAQSIIHIIKPLIVSAREIACFAEHVPTKLYAQTP